MEERQIMDHQKPKQESVPKQLEEQSPTPGDLYRAWKQGGKERLREELRKVNQS